MTAKKDQGFATKAIHVEKGLTLRPERSAQHADLLCVTYIYFDYNG